MVQLSLSGVGVAYGKRRVLSGVDAEDLRGGEVVALIGANAAGKSSLFRRIAGCLRRRHGQPRRNQPRRRPGHAAMLLPAAGHGGECGAHGL